MKYIYILAAILIFGFLIAIHELGHFIAAKLSGVRVNEFSVGMGPELFSRVKGETQYSLRLLPLGGYCALEGEEEDTGDSHSFVRQGFFKKLVILIAGSFMNFLAGILIVAILYSNAAVFMTDSISGFAPEFAHEGEDGLMVGDVFYKIDGKRTYIRGAASMFLGMHQGDTIDLVMLRNGEKVVLDDFPMPRALYTGMEGEAYTGFGLYVGVHEEEATLINKLRYTWYTALDFVQMVWVSLGQLVSGVAGVEDLSGPVGIVSTITEVGTQAETTAAAWSRIFYLAALIAVNLAVMNLLPIPALDGGRILFLILDALCLAFFKKNIPENWQANINTAFFLALMLFMLVVTFHDVTRLF